MKNSKLIYWIIQLISWGILCSMIGFAYYTKQGEFNQQAIFKLVELYILLILVSNCIRWVFIKKDWLNLKLLPLIPRSIGLVVLLAIIFSIINNGINYFTLAEQWPSLSEFLLTVLIRSLFLLSWTTIYLTYHLLKKSRKQEIDNLKLQTTQTQNEVKILRDQLNPHFLFNSLNSIRALIVIEPDAAKEAVTILSNLLRKSLNMGKKEYISLREEIELVNNYLRLEKIRYEERLHYQIQNSVKEEFYIPPFLIQSMAENAIKHGISKKTKGGNVDIYISLKEDCLLLEVWNAGKYENKRRDGVGIDNTKRRLNILYGTDASFTIKNEDNQVKSTIWIGKKYLKKVT